MKKPSCDIHASYSRGCSECNRAYHAALNAALAKARGWTESSSKQINQWATEEFKIWIAPDGKTHLEPPDVCDDPAASRKLVAWMAEQSDEIRSRFEAEIEKAVAPYGGFMILDVLLASVPTIAKAAADALGIEVEQ